MTVVGGRQQSTQRNESGEPEDHSDCLHGWDDEPMRKVGEEHRGEGQIGRCKKGCPDAIEEHEIDGVTATEEADDCDGLATG